VYLFAVRNSTTPIKSSSIIQSVNQSINQSINLLVTTKHTVASTQVQIVTTYEKHLYAVTGSTQ